MLHFYQNNLFHIENTQYEDSNLSTLKQKPKNYKKKCITTTQDSIKRCWIMRMKRTWEGQNIKNLIFEYQHVEM